MMYLHLKTFFLSNHLTWGNQLTKKILFFFAAIILAMEHTNMGLILPEINKWTEKDRHSYFIISRDPYRSIDYITSTFINLPNVSRVLESCFVILPIVPNVFITETSSEYNESFSDVSSIIAQGYHKSILMGSSGFDSETIAQHIKTSTFLNDNRTIKFLSSEERYFDFGLYDYDTITHSFKLARYLTNYNGGSWTRISLREISWADSILQPDECFQDLHCHGDSGK